MDKQTAGFSRVGNAAAWSGASTVVLRFGGLVVGIVIARILTPEQFGVFAIALTVQGILMTVADLGLSADLIRSDNPEKIAPTVGALGLVSGTTLTLAAILSSGVVADALGSPEAAPAIAVLSITLLFGGGGVVPFAMLTRRFQQRELFLIGVVDFVVSTVVTLTLVVLGFGVMGLAIGRVTAQTVSTVLQFKCARVRPRYAIDRSVLRPVLAFGLPIAGANLISWALLNVDNIVLARISGATLLGFYVLAFNISSWPMSALSQIVRSVALPYFSRAGSDHTTLNSLFALAWAVALPIGAILATLSASVIEVVYGVKWLAAAPVLAALGLYGSLRVVFDLLTAFLYATGRSRPVLWIQVLWIVVLTTGMVVATSAYGIEGAGWVHVLIAIGVILPAYLFVIRASGVRLASLLWAALVPTLASIPAVTVVVTARLLIDVPLVQLVVGGFAGIAVYGAIVWAWARGLVSSVRRLDSSPQIRDSQNATTDG